MSGDNRTVTTDALETLGMIVTGMAVGRESRGNGMTKKPREWHEIGPAQQAGIRCTEFAFRKFLIEQVGFDPKNQDDVAKCVREICGIKSRRELATNKDALAIWRKLDDDFQLWMKDIIQ